LAVQKVKVIEVVLDKIRHGWRPEEIHFQHPHLSLAQIHAALTDYYENQPRLDAQIKAGFDASEKLAAVASDPDFRRKLNDLKRSLDRSVLHGRPHSAFRQHRLRLRGIDVLTAQEDRTADYDDALASASNRTGPYPREQDEDLLREGVGNLRTGKPFSGIIFSHQLRITIGQMLEDLELIAKVTSAEEWRGRI
jgi:hypothetical protein